MSFIGSQVASAVISLPLVIPVVLVWWLEMNTAGLLSALLGAAYGLGLAWAACRPAGAALLKREPEILAALRTPEGD